jgi:hypothetical protein
LLGYVGLVVEPVVWSVALGAPAGAAAALLAAGAAMAWRAAGDGLLRGTTSARAAAPALAVAYALARFAGASALRRAPPPPPEATVLLPLPWDALSWAFGAALPALSVPFAAALVACPFVLARERFDETVRAGAAEREWVRLRRAAGAPAGLVGLAMTAFGLGVRGGWLARAVELACGSPLR